MSNPNCLYKAFFLTDNEYNLDNNIKLENKLKKNKLELINVCFTKFFS
jgi:hypothetical protein